MDSRYIVLVEDVTAASDWFAAAGITYASTCDGTIGVAPTCVDMLFLMVEVPLQVLEVVV